MEGRGGEGEKNACSLLAAHPRRHLQRLVSNSAPTLLLSGPRPEKQMQHESRTNPAADSNIQDRWLSGSPARNTCNLPQRPTLHHLALPCSRWRSNERTNERHYGGYGPFWVSLICFFFFLFLLDNWMFQKKKRERERKNTPGPPQFFELCSSSSLSHREKKYNSGAFIMSVDLYFFCVLFFFSLLRFCAFSGSLLCRDA